MESNKTDHFKFLGSAMTAHTSPISGVAAWGGRYVATAGYDNKVILWDAEKGVSLSRAFHDHLANQCVFSPCGRYLVSTSSDYTARVWSVPELRLLAVLGDHEDDVESVAFHPEMPLLATACRDSLVRVFSLEGRLVAKFRGHTSDASTVEWLAGSRELVSSSDDGTVKKWSLDTGGLVENLDLNGVQTDAVVISPEGVIYAGNDNGEIVILAGAEPVLVRAHEAGVKRLVLNVRLGFLLSMSYDRTVKIWRTGSRGGLELAAQASLPAEIWPRSCAFKGDSEIVFGTFGTKYASYDYKSGKWDFSGVEPTWGVNAVCAVKDDLYTVGDAGVVFKNGAKHAELGSLCNFLTPFGNNVLAGGQMGIVFDAAGGRTIYQHRSPLNCGAVFYSGGVLKAIVGAYTGEGLIFGLDAEGRAVFERAIALHDNAVKGVAFSGGRIMSVCATGAAAFHDAETLECLRRIPGAHDKIANGCAALSEGRFASVSRDKKLRIWEPDGLCRVYDTPHTHSIKCVSAFASGNKVATGSYDGTVAVFDLESETWISCERPTYSGISSLCAGGPGALASSYDGRVYRI